MFYTVDMFSGLRVLGSVLFFAATNPHSVVALPWMGEIRSHHFEPMVGIYVGESNHSVGVSERWFSGFRNYPQNDFIAGHGCES